MNHLIKDVQVTSLTGTTTTNMNMRGWLYFTVQFTAYADLPEGEGAQFAFMCAPANEADPCLPGTFEPILEVALCDSRTPPAEAAIVALTGPIEAGRVCYATVPCHCGDFVTVLPVGAAEAPAADPNFPSGREGDFAVFGLQKGPR